MRAVCIRASARFGWPSLVSKKHGASKIEKNSRVPPETAAAAARHQNHRLAQRYRNYETSGSQTSEQTRWIRHLRPRRLATYFQCQLGGGICYTHLRPQNHHPSHLVGMPTTHHTIEATARSSTVPTEVTTRFALTSAPCRVCSRNVIYKIDRFLLIQIYLSNLICE